MKYYLYYSDWTTPMIPLGDYDSHEAAIEAAKTKAKETGRVMLVGYVGSVGWNYVYQDGRVFTEF